MKIFIRADGGNIIGLGHIMRMLVLSKELSKNNEVIFLCRSSNIENKEIKRDFTEDKSELIEECDKFRAGIEKVRETGFEVFMIREEHVVEDILNLQNKNNADMIITDSYDVDELYFDSLKPYFKITGYIDDMNKCKMNVDLIINQNFSAEYIDYSKNINKNTKLFLGSNYCMLREEFRNRNFNYKKTSEEVKDILLTLGGMDKEYNTLKILKQIENLGKKIYVVIGNAFDNALKEKLFNISQKNPNIILHENPSMSELMNKCDIAISACGSTLYELCAMKISTIGIIIADNQEELGKQMVKKGAILGGKWIDAFKDGEIIGLLYELLNKKEVREDIINIQKDLVNINGVVLLANEIEQIEFK